jgi:RNA polymerase sigma factor (sigma-70 family)
LDDTNRTTAAVQLYLDDLGRVAGDSGAEPIVRALLARAVSRLQGLCAAMLHRQYPRLMQGPMNLSSEEVLSGVVERLIRAMRAVRPPTVRQFFALANQHMRWELNDLARRLDERARETEIGESRTAKLPEASDGPGVPPIESPGLLRILAAIENLPPEELEVFNLVRIQGMSHPEAAAVVGCSEKTIQRRLRQSLMLLAEKLDQFAPS